MKDKLRVFNLFQNVPKTYNDKANKLLEFIEKTPSIEWRESGKIFVDGTEVVGANMTELVNDAIRHRKKAKPARGREQFASALLRAGVPHDYIGNHSFWRVGDQINSQASLTRSNVVDTSQAYTTVIQDPPAGTSSPIASSSMWESWTPNRTRRRKR